MNRKQLHIVSVAATSTGGREAAFRRLERQLAEAAAMEGQLVCLPEACFWSDFNAADSAEPENGATVEFYAAMAEKYRIALLAPLLLREKRHCYNAMLWFDADGALQGIYRKCHPTQLELERGIRPGPEKFEIFDTPWGKIGCAVCFDINFRQVIERNVELGARLIVFPTMFQGLALMRAWARLFRVYFLSAVSAPYSALVTPLGQTRVEPWCHGEVWQSVIDMDFEVVTTDKMELFPELKLRYGGDVEIETIDLESAALISCRAPNTSVNDMLREFDIPPEKDYLAEY